MLLYTHARNYTVGSRWNLEINVREHGTYSFLDTARIGCVVVVAVSCGLDRDWWVLYRSVISSSHSVCGELQKNSHRNRPNRQTSGVPHSCGPKSATVAAVLLWLIHSFFSLCSDSELPAARTTRIGDSSRALYSSKDRRCLETFTKRLREPKSVKNKSLQQRIRSKLRVNSNR